MHAPSRFRAAGKRAACTERRRGPRSEPTSLEFALDQFTTYRPVVRAVDRRVVSAVQDALAPLVQDTTRSLSGFNDPRWSLYGYSPEFVGVKLQPAGRGALAAYWNSNSV